MIGILGGGQLARMTIQAAIALGVEIAIYARKPDSPAGRLTQHEIIGEGWQDEGALSQLAALVDRVTLENEFVDAAVLDRLAAMGAPVYPTGRTLGIIQDKLRQKDRLHAVGIPVPEYARVDTPGDISSAGLGWPVVLKAREGGYDGYGNATVHDETEATLALRKLDGRKLLAEAWVPFERELAVMVVRGHTGEISTYPVVETVQKDHICHVVRAPAPVSQAVADRATQIAVEAVEAVEGVGVFGVELFLLPDETILYNEMAPRPHNSGHYTIEGAVTSQFENHLRAVLGWPLGSTALRAPAVVMVNILGARQGEADMAGIRDALAVGEAHVHLYGKRTVRPGRKMGHVTALAGTLEEAEQVARTAADRVML
ncbi:MAG: 5-(carboxyamino)imidazole ribonucleotide synthase [Chloroflexi bacterium]|nr:5-(carboxyamino)imidazole ribonucleotide synthase [Chloroflexota bacterium]